MFFLCFCCLSGFSLSWFSCLLLEIIYFIVCCYILYTLFIVFNSYLNLYFRENNDRFLCTCSMFSKFPIHFGVKQQQVSLQSLGPLMCLVLLSRQRLNYIFHKQMKIFFTSLGRAPLTCQEKMLPEAHLYVLGMAQALYTSKSLIIFYCRVLNCY